MKKLGKNFPVVEYGPEAEEGNFPDALPKKEQLEWIDEEGTKWVCCNVGKMHDWRLTNEVGTYRYTDGGIESRGEDGEWVNYAQMPQDTSHLTDAQRERLIKELRGEIKVSTDDGTGAFKPMAKVPPLEKWPSHGVTITEELKATEEEMADYKVLDMTVDIGRAFFLASRWKLASEARRHLGYSVNDEITDVANMNGTVLALRCMVEQLKRLKRFRVATMEDELPSDAYRLKELRITGLLGTEKGSAIAIWFYSDQKKRAFIDLCIGDDCMDQGTLAEEMMLKQLAIQTEELGGTEMWCRTRRTESGKVFVPKYFPKLGFEAVPLDQQQEEEWEVFQLSKDEDEVKEGINGLGLWLSTRSLSKYLEAANTWCYDMGAADLLEVAENKADLAEYLEKEEGLTEEEKERLMMY